MKTTLRTYILRVIYWYLHKLPEPDRESFAFGILASSDREYLGSKLLRDSGAKACILSSRIEPYLDEITKLCAREELYVYSTDDVLGSGYFRARRVMSKMKQLHPELRVRDLWKAVDYCSALCSTSVASGPKETSTRHPQEAIR